MPIYIDGSGVVYNAIPSPFDGVSNFHALTDAERAEHGFFVLTEQQPTLLITEKKGSHTDTLQQDGITVLRTWSVVNKSSVEIQAEKDTVNAPIKAQLRELDVARSRPLGDVALGNGNVADAQGKTPLQRLLDIESQRVALTAQLV